jgi:hypothetical protein
MLMLLFAHPQPSEKKPILPIRRTAISTNIRKSSAVSRKKIIAAWWI